MQDFSPASIEQATLFGRRDQRHDALMQAFDHINKQYGQNTVRLGAQGKRMWRMHQERLSPRYSTDISDNPYTAVVKVIRTQVQSMVMARLHEYIVKGCTMNNEPPK